MSATTTQSIPVSVLNELIENETPCQWVDCPHGVTWLYRMRCCPSTFLSCEAHHDYVVQHSDMIWKCKRCGADGWLTDIVAAMVRV